MSETLLQLRGDRLDLGLIHGDVLKVIPAIAANPGQIITTRTPEGNNHVQRHDGTTPVTGLVTWMYRRVPGADEVVS